MISVDNDAARKLQACSASALAQLPGVTTSIAAAGDSIVRETLPGESRFESQ